MNIRFLKNGQGLWSCGRLVVLGISLLAGSCSGKKESGGTHPDAAWYVYDSTVATRWSSPENPEAGQGAGGKENGAAKGRPYIGLDPGQAGTLLEVQGPGIVSRIWLTVIDRSPEMLRSLRLEMYWDGQEKPAVSVPLGDFFGPGLGRAVAFNNAAFANPEGRSFVSYVPMPFRKGARILVRNDSDKRLTHLFFDVDFLRLKNWDDKYLYFHAYWHRDTATALARDFEILPRVRGRGRWLGTNTGVNTNPLYGDSWWGEGEVKIYLNGDQEWPTLAGTGTEDFIGTGWGQGAFSNPFTGCLIADAKNNQWTFYRFHIPDPVYFDSAIRVTLQQIGGHDKSKVLAMLKAKVPLIPVTIDDKGKMILLYQDKKALESADLPDGWTNFYRSDDLSATAYFYLDSPTDELPPLQPLAVRTYNLKSPPATK